MGRRRGLGKWARVRPGSNLENAAGPTLLAKLGLCSDLGDAQGQDV